MKVLMRGGCLVLLLCGTVAARAQTVPDTEPPVKAVHQTERKSKPERVKEDAPEGPAEGRSARGSRPERSARGARGSHDREARAGRGAGGADRAKREH